MVPNSQREVASYVNFETPFIFKHVSNCLKISVEQERFTVEN